MIALDAFSYSYPDAPQPALADVSLSITRGELVVIAGAAGSGKSTLLYAITGLIPHFFREGAYSGRVVIDGHEVAQTQLTTLATYFGTVYQDPNAQLFGLKVEDAIAFGLENENIGRAAMRGIVNATLERLSLTRLRGRSTQTLSGGERQATAIAAMVAMKPPVIVLDEPLSALDPRGRALVQQVIQQAIGEGATVIVADQDLENWTDIAGRLVVLDEARVAYDGPLAAYLADPHFAATSALIMPDTVRIWHTLNPAERPPLNASIDQLAASLTPVGESVNDEFVSQAAPPASPAVEVHNVTFTYGAQPLLNNVSLTLPRGTRVGLIGHNGSGKSTLVKLIAGLLRPQQGRIAVDGQDIAPLSPSQIVQRVAYLFQNPSRMFLTRTVHDEIAFSLRGRLPKEQIDASVTHWLQRFELERRAQDVPSLLSEGEKQRLALACVLALDPLVVILDEPTLGQSRGDRRRIVDLMSELSTSGHLVIMISHDLRLVAEATDRLVVMEGGRVRAEGPTREILYDDAVFQSIGLPRPALVDVARAAGRRGVITVDELIGVIA